MSIETVGTNVGCKKACNNSKMTLPTPSPLPPPVLMSASSRQISTPVPLNPVIHQVINKEDPSSSAYEFIPRIVPDFRSSHEVVRSSALRSTLNNQTPYGKGRNMSAPSALMGKPVPSKEPTTDSSPQSRRPISDLLKIAKYMDDQGRNDLDEHEKDTTLALLVLKECSKQVFNMSEGWSHLTSIPLCDFVVAQRKCQTMLNSIQTLKEIRIQSRDSTVDDQTSNTTERYSAREKNVKFQEENYKSRSPSSSVLSLINADPSSTQSEGPPAQREKVAGPRSSSMSSERTLTYSPLSSGRSTPSSIPLENNSDNNYSPYPPVTNSKSKSDNVFISFSDGDRKRMGKIGKTSKSGKNRNAHMRCLHCSSTETPEWRKGPDGPTTLCNACGLFYKKLIKKFGKEMATAIMKTRQTENPQDRKIPRFARI